MSAEQNKKIVERIFNEAINNRNYDLVEELIAPGFVNHGMQAPSPGPESFKFVIEQFVNAFPDMKIQLHQVIGDMDTVATRGTWKGTHKGDFMGMPATGKQVEIGFIDVWKLQDNKAVENWVQMDIAGLMQQLGAMPS